MTVTVVQVTSSSPLLTTCVAPLGCVMMMFLTDWLLHSENELVFVKLVFTTTDHELSTGLQQSVNLVMYIMNSTFCRFCNVYRWVDKHAPSLNALVKGWIEVILVSNELCQVLYLMLLISITANDAISGGNIVYRFYGWKIIALIAYIARIVHLLSLGLLKFACCHDLLRLLLQFDFSAHIRTRLLRRKPCALSLGIFEVGRGSEVEFGECGHFGLSRLTLSVC